MTAHIQHLKTISSNSACSARSAGKAIWLHHIAQFALVALLVLSSALINSPVLAQTMVDMSGYTIENIGAATTQTDSSTKIVGALVGINKVSSWSAPLTTMGTADTWLSMLFFALNACIYGVIASSLLWSVLTQIAESAKDGTVLGKQMSGVWAPIRAAFGAIGGVPAFAGFSLLQSVVLVCALLGIGIANMLCNVAWDAFEDGVPLVPVAESTTNPNLTGDIHDLVRSAFALEICRQASNYSAQELSGGLPYAEIPAAAESTSGDTTQYSFGTCGYTQLQARRGSTASKSTELGFTIDSVDYSAVADAVHTTARGTMRSVVEQVTALADTAYESYASTTYSPATNANTNSDTALSSITANAIAQLKIIEQQAMAQLSAGLKESSRKANATNTQYIEEEKKGGWINLGVSSMTFFAQSAAINDAMSSYTYSTNPLYLTSSNKYVSDAEKFWGLADASNASGAAAKSAGWLTTPTGNVSLGQALASQAVNIAFAGSGGGDQVNPTIAAKNMGDYMIVAGETMLGVDLALKSPLAYLIPGGKVASFIIDKTLGPILEPIAWTLMGLGLFLSIYIPGLMFLLFAAAVLEWLTQLFEALLYAQISALMYMDLRQEGLMQGAASKYLLSCLGMLLRPAVIVISFFAAMAIQISVASWLLPIIGTLMANIQGASITGLLSILGLILLVAVLMWGLVQTTGGLMSTIPAALLNWTGAGESRHGNMFIGTHAGSAMRGINSGSSGTAVKAAAKPTEFSGRATAKAVIGAV